MKGRLNNSPDIADNVKHPIILNRYNYITALILQQYHEHYYHQLSETIVNEVRQKYWIPGLRVAVKNIIRSCQKCKNQKVIPQPPEMCTLPPERVTAFKPAFNATGMDYFGPFNVMVRRSVEKRYGVLFTCLASRAVHIEIADSLNTDSCIMAMQRFIGRRGTPSHIYSDNGTNIFGASRELRGVIQELNWENLADRTSTLGIKWHFNTPASPHHGGVWERLIRTVKRVLQQMLLSKLPRPETLHTVMVQVESILNNRPLSYVSLEPNAEEAITPNHLLLLGRSSGQPLMQETAQEDQLSRKQWKQAEAMANQFWRRWITEYLPTLNRRTKWFNEKIVPIKVDDVVMLVDPSTKRNEWSLGRIVETYPGKDGKVRSVCVKTKKGVYKRPVTKIAKLDVEK